MNDYPTEEEAMQLNRMMPEEDDVMAAMVKVFEDRCKLETGPGRLSLVEWILKINSESQRVRAEVAARAEEIIRDEEKRIQYVNEHFCQRFEREAQALYENRPDKKKKSVKLLTGTIGYHSGKESIHISDKTKALAWAKTNCPDAIKVEESLLKTPLMEYFKTNGAEPDGCQYKPATEHFSAKPIDGKDIQARPQLPEGEDNGPADD